MRILGIDPGLQTTGFGVIDAEGHGLRYVASGTITTTHLARANLLAAHLDGSRALASLADHDAYVSPDWYGSEDQVPTWLYIAVEAEGPVRRLGDDELVEQVDGLSAVHEAALAPKPIWTREKMSPARYDALLHGIVGFELNPESLRGTRKLNQNKHGSDRDGALAGLRGVGRDALAALVETAR